MDDATLKRYRGRLIEIQRDLVSRVLEVEDEIETVDHLESVEVMERVQADVLADTLERLDGLEREQMEAAEAALERIERGTYGICADCGREIPRARLDSLPWAERCEEDQERFEKERSERSGPHPRG